MKAFALAIAWLALSSPDVLATQFTGSLGVGGRLGVGVSSPAARAEIRASSTATAVLQVTGYFASPLFSVSSGGDVALGTVPAARFDVAAVDATEVVALELRAGGPSTGTAGWQALMGYDGKSQYRHGIKSVHAGGVAGNGVYFYLWTQAAGSANALPVVLPLALVTHSTGTSVHVRPVPQLPDVEMVVSDGSDYSQGTVHRLTEGTHSSVRLKADIERLGLDAQDAALQETLSLKHASYRFRGYKTPRRGLIFDEAPQDLRAPGDSLIVDERVANAELALQAVIRRLRALEAEAGSLGGGPR